jgi:hypothetical protein
LNVNAIGIYTKVSSPLAAAEYERLKLLLHSNLQTITIVDLADTNTVTVNVAGQGKYEYSLDEPNGPFNCQISLIMYQLGSMKYISMTVMVRTD